MTEKKDPNQEKVASDSSDNDLIVELTDEVVTKSDDNTFVDLNDQIIDDNGEFAEDDFTVSPIEESSENADDDRLMLIDEFGLNSEENSDAIILDEIDGNLTDDTLATKTDEDDFDFEEEIEINIEGDEDEYDVVGMDDEYPDDSNDRPDLLKDLEIKYDEEDDTILVDKDQEEKPETMALQGNENPESEAEGDLPGLISEIEFAFEDDDDDAIGIGDMDEQKAEDGADIITKIYEQSPDSEEVEDRSELTQESEIESRKDGEVISPDDAQVGDEEIIASAQAEIPDFNHDKGLLDLDDDIRLEPENEIIPTDEFDEFDDISAEEEDIIEITEFDEHFPEEDEGILEHADVLDESDAENQDFVELIEIEEEELLESETTEEVTAETGISSYINNTSDEETGLENNVAESVEETPALSPEIGIAAEVLSSEVEEFDFDLESEEISQQVDELNVFSLEDSSPEPEVATLPEDQPQEDEPTQEDLQTITDKSESLAVSPELIATAVERVINEKLSGKIEDIIYQVIEKAVSREISRLKEALFEDSTPGDNQ